MRLSTWLYKDSKLRRKSKKRGKKTRCVLTTTSHSFSSAWSTTTFVVSFVLNSETTKATKSKIWKTLGSRFKRNSKFWMQRRCLKRSRRRRYCCGTKSWNRRRKASSRITWSRSRRRTPLFLNASNKTVTRAVLKPCRGLQSWTSASKKIEWSLSHWTLT